jgi:hypothetical protein
VNGRITEHHHYTREQVSEHLRDALDVVDELGPADDLRVACFTKAVDLLSAKQRVMEQIVPGILGGVRPPGG